MASTRDETCPRDVERPRAARANRRRRVREAVVAALAVAFAGLPAGADSLSVSFLECHEIYDKSAGFTEPSGLAMAQDGTFLWAISDDDKAIFRLGFDGRVEPADLPGLPKRGAEGIALRPDGSGLLVLRENDNRLYEIGLPDGEVLADRALSELDGYADVAVLFAGSPKNKGLEGITVDRASGVVFVVKEGEPRLILALSPRLDRVLMHRHLDQRAGFGENLGRSGTLDVSGIVHDPTRNLFWIVSDRGQRLFLYDHAQGTATSIPLVATIDGKERRVKHAEGIAIDAAGGRLFIVTDDGKGSLLCSYAIE